MIPQDVITREDLQEIAWINSTSRERIEKMRG